MPRSASSAAQVPRRRQRSGGLGLPRALAHGQHEVDPAAQPVQVVAVEVGHVVARVGEVRRVPAVAPGVPLRRVVVAALADRHREQVSAGQREVQRVVGAEAAAGHDHVADARGVLADETGHLVGDPGLVGAVPLGARLERDRAVRPGVGVVRVDAVELDPAGLDQVGDGAHHPVVLVVPRPALLAGEHQHRASVVAVADDRPGPVEAGCRELDMETVHQCHTFVRRSVRCGSRESRQQVQV